MTLALLVLLAQSDWSAVTALKPGQTVLVSYAKSFAEGPLVSADADRVVVRTAKGEVNAARVDIKKLWVPGNRRGRNALIGGAIGIGVAIGPALFLQRRLDNENSGGTKAAFALLGLGGGIGAGGGSLNSGRTLIYRP